jgi:hypothetical protein
MASPSDMTRPELADELGCRRLGEPGAMGRHRNACADNTLETWADNVLELGPVFSPAGQPADRDMPMAASRISDSSRYAALQAALLQAPPCQRMRAARWSEARPYRVHHDGGGRWEPGSKRR